MPKRSSKGDSLLRQILRLVLALLESMMAPGSPPTKPKSGAGRTGAGERKTPAKAKPRKARRRARSPIAKLAAKKQSDTMVTDSGVIVKLLPDDNEGSRHQRMLVEVDSGRLTIKIAHNIDLAPRVPAREGDTLTFRGEYEWNQLGGALHWTHHDPKQWREGGWIEHRGNRYE